MLFGDVGFLEAESKSAQEWLGSGMGLGWGLKVTVGVGLGVGLSISLGIRSGIDSGITVLHVATCSNYL